MRQIAAILFATLLLAGSALACIWDSDTLSDELQTHVDVFDLITGQFPHHGQVYYETRVINSLANLKQEPRDIEARNDLAVAYLKLSRFDQALAEFDRIEEMAPGRYETRSNLGVLYKKMGDYERAADYSQQALALKPEGHLGLGDYYLKMLQFQSEMNRPGVEPPAESFLGEAYYNPDFLGAGGPAPGDLDRIKALIRSDRSFADGLVTLGDWLVADGEGAGNLNLALWAYVRAGQLDHPHPDLLDRKMKGIFRHWKAVSGDRPGIWTSDPESTIRQIEAYLEKAGEWLKSFEQIEEELIKAGGEVDFAAVEAEMERRGITRYRAPDRGIQRGSLVSEFLHGGPSERAQLWRTARVPVAIGLGGLMVAALFAGILLRRRRRTGPQ